MGSRYGASHRIARDPVVTINSLSPGDVWARARNRNRQHRVMMIYDSSTSRETRRMGGDDSPRSNSDRMEILMRRQGFHSVIATLLLGLLAVAASAMASTPATETQRLRDFLDLQYDEAIRRSPMLATEFNDLAGYDRWDDLSDASLAAQAVADRRALQIAESSFDSRLLDPAGRLQLKIFIDQQQLMLDRYRWRNHFYALNQIVGLHVAVPDMLTNQQPMATVADAKAYIRRVRAVRPLFDQLIVRMREQAKQGIYMPRSVYPLLIEAASNVVRGEPHTRGADSPIFADFRRRVRELPVSDSDRDNLLSECRTALLQQLEPAYRHLISDLSAQQGRTKIDGGVWQLPDGDAFYAFLVRQFTTTDMSPAEVHALGMREVARLQAEMGALLGKMGYTGTLREFVAQTKADPRFYEPDSEEGREHYLARARAIVAAMQSKTTEAFFAPAPLPLEVRRVEPFKEATAPAGFYEGGSPDGKRPGIVYLNLADMHLNPVIELEDLLYHEGIPGHHMQISTILVDKTIPRLRKVSPWWQNSAFVEGWGLYAEQLAKDMGFYQDPYSEFGRLSGELWRATRLVVDSGLHFKRWSRAEAIRYLNDNTPSPAQTNAAAVDRYLAVPGQATSFTVGMQAFVAERERARAALGNRFDIREYHQVALHNGYVPLWALRQAVSDWMLSKGATIP